MKKFIEMSDEELAQTLKTLESLNSDEVASVMLKIRQEQNRRAEQKKREEEDEQKKEKEERASKSMLEAQKEVLTNKYYANAAGEHFKVHGVFDDYAFVEQASSSYLYYKAIKLDDLLKCGPSSKVEFEAACKARKNLYADSDIAETIYSIFSDLKRFI